MRLAVLKRIRKQTEPRRPRWLATTLCLFIALSLAAPRAHGVAALSASAGTSVVYGIFGGLLAVSGGAFTVGSVRRAQEAGMAPWSWRLVLFGPMILFSIGAVIGGIVLLPAADGEVPRLQFEPLTLAEADRLGISEEDRLVFNSEVSVRVNPLARRLRNRLQEDLRAAVSRLDVEHSTDAELAQKIFESSAEISRAYWQNAFDRQWLAAGTQRVLRHRIREWHEGMMRELGVGM